MKRSPHDLLKDLGLHVPIDGIEIDPNDRYRLATLLALLGEQMRVDAIAEADLQAMWGGMHGTRGQDPGAPATPAQLARLRESLTETLHQVLGMKTAYTAPTMSKAAAGAAELAGHAFDFAEASECDAGQVLVALCSVVPAHLSSDETRLAESRLQQLLVGRGPLRVAQIYADFVTLSPLEAFADALRETYRPRRDWASLAKARRAHMRAAPGPRAGLPTPHLETLTLEPRCPTFVCTPPRRSMAPRRRPRHAGNRMAQTARSRWWRDFPSGSSAMPPATSRSTTSGARASRCQARPRRKPWRRPSRGA
ncbi:hypothetical protein [Burkholderia gladioli]|uniref:hypothetical protein n=1 Tax=Burkholderia gladioli TaxID=28095 RepID=UPI000BF178BF|nr:hypothetical protein [Burkholderia gladioli]PEH80363.1 hypothetical protein CRM95_35990 [Burkholderia gladioli]